jgi:lipopolysaccharide export system permease protein
VRTNATKITDNFLTSIKNDHAYFQSLYFKGDKTTVLPNQGFIDEAPHVIRYEDLSEADKITALQSTQAKIRRKNQNLDGQNEYIRVMEIDLNTYWIEFHRKFALTFAIIVLFFIGAPLGAIVRRGGFGAPVVIAALLFMVYFVLISVGDSLAASQVVSPFIGMWFASMVLLPIAIILMRSAANDSPVFDKEAWVKRFKRNKSK